MGYVDITDATELKIISYEYSKMLRGSRNLFQNYTVMLKFVRINTHTSNTRNVIN
jgi:hypothetical protein